MHRLARPRPLGTRILAILALLALAATSLTPLVNPEWNGWRPDHGHAALGPVEADHSHPWDAPAADAETDVVFTGGDSVPGVTALWTPTPEGASAVLARIAVPDAGMAPPQEPPAVPAAPPPQGVLSHT